MPTTATQWLDESPNDAIALGEMLQDIGAPVRVFTELPPWMKQGMAKQLNESFKQDYWDKISQTTAGDAERYLRKGLAEGWSIRRIADTMAHSFQGHTHKYATRRATNIARTESANALNGARKVSMEQLVAELGPQVPMRPSWLSVLGNTTRESHAALDGVPCDENGMWNLSGYMVPWPGHVSLLPGERCGCQCTVTTEFGMTKEEASRLIQEHHDRVDELEEIQRDQQEEGEIEGEPPKEEMPFDDLASAQMDVAARIGEMDERMEQMQMEMEGVRAELEAVNDERAEAVDPTPEQTEGWNGRRDELESVLEGMQTDLDGLFAGRDQLQGRLDYLEHLEGMYGKSFEKYSSTSQSDAAHNLIQQAFDPKQWKQELVDAALPVLAVKMAESATAYLLSLGFDVRGKKGFEKRAGAGEQFYARENEKLLARKLKGIATGINSPIDVELKIGGKWHGIEVKTMLDNKHEKIKVDPHTGSKKEEWERRTGGTIHTVVFDDSEVVPGKTRREGIEAIRRRREDGDSSGFDTSKRVVYYKRGWGSFRLGGMTQIKGSPWATLKELMASELEDEKYHPGQPRDDHGRFTSGGTPTGGQEVRERGLCYERSGKAVLYGNPAIDDWENVRLCHGYPIGAGGEVEGKKMGHAWVEGKQNVPIAGGGGGGGTIKVDMVFDADSDTTVPCGLFYAIGQINFKEVQRYTKEEARTKALSTGHWGPWENVPPGILLKPLRGFDLLEKYSPTQPRDDHGRFTSGGGMGGMTPSNPSGRDSMEQYQDASGKWTSERKVLHDKIMAEAFVGKTPVDQPTAYLMGGGTASGKSSILRSGQVTLPKNTVAIDADAIKAKLPEYQSMLRAGDKRAATFAHEESSYLSKKIMKKATDESYNMMLDGTGDSSMAKLEKKAAVMRSKGAKVEANYVTVDTDTAVARSLARAKKTGRYVPESVVRHIHADVSRVLPKAASKGLFDKVTLWDTSGGGAAVKVMSGSGSKMTVHNQERWRVFLAKGE